MMLSDANVRLCKCDGKPCSRDPSITGVLPTCEGSYRYDYSGKAHHVRVVLPCPRLAPLDLALEGEATAGIVRCRIVLNEGGESR
jgi:hypothetical protein